MSDNWIVQNLENALEVWNDKLSEIWQLITQSPQTFKGSCLHHLLCLRVEPACRGHKRDSGVYGLELYR